MKMTDKNSVKVVSSNIARVGYEAVSKVLFVKFTNGSVYQYVNVPTEKFYEFLNAESKGKFLNESIRDEFVASKLVEDI